MAVPKELLSIVRQYAARDYHTPLHAEQYAGTDLEEFVRLIETIAEHAKQAEDNETVFVSNVAHELRTPVTIIRGFVDGMLDGTIPKSERTETLAIISQETRRLNAIITSMLNLTKLEEGTLSPHYQWFTLNDVVFHTLLMFQNRLEKRGISVEGLNGSSLRIYADPDLMGQVIFNLVENAVKFVNVNGTISFTFAQTPQEWSLIVRNTGNGIPKDEQSKLFTRFYQSNASQSSDKTGLGIGLDLTRRILELHHAQILIRSEIHAYTEFEIRLPRHCAETATEEV